MCSNPPLVEAVLEFQFMPTGRPWAPDVLTRLHKRLEAEFPMSESLTGTNIMVDAQRPGAISLSPAPETRRFARQDGGMVVTVGPDVLGVSVLHDKMPGGHPGWESFRDVALQVLDAYRNVVHPGPMKQVGVRYINAIRFDPSAFRLEKFVDRSVGLVPSALLSETNPVSLRVERLREPGQQSVRKETFNLVAAPDPEGAGGKLVLDVDEVLMLAPGTELPYLAEVCDKLHEAVAKIFKSVINAKTRRSFGILTPQPK
jgi:uncharacterized protein (TIGR04255 family)